METLGKPFLTKKSKLEWSSVVGGGTRTEGSMSQVAEAWLRRGVKKLAESWEEGEGKH